MSGLLARAALLVIVSCFSIRADVIPSDVYRNVDEAYKYATDQLKLQNKYNHEYYEQGVDNYNTENCATMSAMFSSPSKAAVHKDKCAYVKLQMVKKLESLTHMKFNKMNDNRYQAACDKVMTKMCPKPPAKDCDDRAKYQSIDGSCNNLKYPLWGAANIAQLRILPAAYENGIDDPRQNSAAGGKLPSTRIVSNGLFRPDGSTKLDPTFNVMHMSFGQFFDHDFVKTPVETGENGTALNCCNRDEFITNRDSCLPIRVPKEDPDISRRCMNFVRSSATSPDEEGNKQLTGVREQENDVTSYIDASNVYGSSKEVADSLRKFKNGLMKLKSGHRLPKGPLPCIKEHPIDYCQNAGDARVNVVPNLGATHRVWVQEHNRIAFKLSKMNFNWDDERIYQETRKIIIGMMQHIAYNEYIPPAIGSSTMNDFGLTVGTPYTYDPSINSGLINSFGAAAFRFGHSQITLEQINTPIEETFQRPFMCLRNKGEGYDDLLRWLEEANAAVVDNEFESGVRDKLFIDAEGRTLDLPAVNTQRGRDHGLPSYNKYRVLAGLPKATDFTESGMPGVSSENIMKLKAIYKHVDDIDLFPGGIAESPIPGAMVGQTFAFLMGKQFHNMKYGDRFWYENNVGGATGFTAKQLEEVKKATLAKVVCVNVGIKKIQPQAFKVPGIKGNRKVKCKKLPEINLEEWREVGSKK